MSIGIIGTGQIGSAVENLLKASGHDVRMGSRHPEGDQVSILEAISYGEIVVVAVPFGVWPTLADEIAGSLAGKILIDAGNPNPGRDGQFAVSAMEHPVGPGAPVAALLPNARLVRSFSTMVASHLLRLSDRANPTYALPVAGDDSTAVSIVAKLVRETGFIPVVTGDLSTAKFFAPGTDVFGGDMNADMALESMKDAGLQIE